MRLAYIKFLVSIVVWLTTYEYLAGQTLRIDRLKANYLINFADFVRWDGQMKNDDVTIGVLNDDDLEWELRKMSNEASGNRTIHVVGLDGTEKIQLEKIDILFAGTGRARVWKSLKERCRGLNILLVGEDREFLEDGGAIQFTFRKNRLRFYVDQENANSLGIQLSSKLIELALERPR